MRLCAAALLLLSAAAARAHERPWVESLHARLPQIDAGFPGDLGVYVQRLDTGEIVSYRGDDSWYLASGIKVPVAIAVLRAMHGGEFGLESTVVLDPSDYVDGAGPTQLHPPGTALRVDYLLEQMIVASDNLATDLLIKLVGLERVNAVMQELAASWQGSITTLADVRRRAYSGLHEKALQLTGNDLLALKRVRNEADRVHLLSQLLDVPESEFLTTDLDTAYDAYYAMRLNAATLRDYVHVLLALEQGHALPPAPAAHLLGLMERVETGRHRLIAGLPQGIRFAHKTGTQRGRTCDFGLIDSPARLAIAACTRGHLRLSDNERALRAVAAAVVASGALDLAADGDPQ